MHNNSYILQTNHWYFPKILRYHNINYTPSPVGQFLYIDGFLEYNYLHDINAVFSTNPAGNTIDRTQTIKSPFNFHIERPWKLPSNSLTFDECFAKTVQNFNNQGVKLNLFWSGGIDSTAMIVGFLKHSADLSNVRILYSVMSIKENPSFFMMLQNRQDIELLEFSGDVYLTQTLDGIFVTGDGADDLTASLDESFFDVLGFNGVHSSWKDLFYSRNPNLDFIDFCQQYINNSGADFTTVLEARWWFYTNTKITKYPSEASYILRFDQPLAVGFFDNYDFENYMFFNIDKIIKNNSYSTYKYQFKEYIFDYHKDYRYFKHKLKTNSIHMMQYREKLMALKNQQCIILLADGTRVATDNLPFLSKKEYRQKYQNTLDYLFNV